MQRISLGLHARGHAPLGLQFAQPGVGDLYRDLDVPLGVLDEPGELRAGLLDGLAELSLKEGNHGVQMQGRTRVILGQVSSKARGVGWPKLGKIRAASSIRPVACSLRVPTQRTGPSNVKTVPH